MTTIMNAISATSFHSGAGSAITAAGSGASGKLSEAEQELVDKLAKRDKEVRQHEQAHISAAAGLATGGATYSMQTGPDGKQYAVGGEVRIDVSPGNTPEETLSKARTIQAAALAPGDPSAADHSVAAAAEAMAAKALAEIASRSPAQQKLAAHYSVDESPHSTLSASA